jgi:hypothetical protein
MLGDAAACASRWYAVGGYSEPGTGTRPAAWSTVDGDRWVVVPVHPSGAYGPHQMLYSVACSGGRIAALGAASGGVHGNPRTSTWRLDSTGALVEVDAPFELYGGPNAISVDRLAGNDRGFVIAGTRLGADGRSTAAVWTSPTGEQFTLHDGLGAGAPGLTSAVAATATPLAWIVVGTVLRAGTTAREPYAWSSNDGSTWTGEPIPGDAGEDAAAERSVAFGGAVVAVGVRGTGFGAWRRSTAGGWSAIGRFGSIRGSALPQVSGLTGAASRVYATVNDGSAFGLYSSRDGAQFDQVGLPAGMTAGAQRRLIVAGTADLLLLGADDGASTRLWLAPAPAA